jgi:hypothetical protein
MGARMTTELLVATSGLDPGRVQAVVPPECRTPPLTLAPATVDDARGEATLSVPAWAPRTPARHLLPAFSPLIDVDWSGRFEVSVRADGAWSPWVGTASLGPAAFESLPGAADVIAAEIDVFLARRPAAAVRLRLRLSAPDVRAVLAAPWLLTLSASDAAGDAQTPTTPVSGTSEASRLRVRLPVPPLSQMGEDPAIALRVCSPASVAMVLGFWGRPVGVAALASEVYHGGLDLYGIWPAAIRAAARRGVAGYLLRFPDWTAAAWCLARGLPVIASLRYGPGELAGAAIDATTGHLIVLTGAEDDAVLVNDPAARDEGTVARRYHRAELQRVWLERSGVGYVLFAP